jgi:hypothetical protein
MQVDDYRNAKLWLPGASPRSFDNWLSVTRWAIPFRAHQSAFGPGWGSLLDIHLPVYVRLRGLVTDPATSRLAIHVEARHRSERLAVIIRDVTGSRELARFNSADFSLNQKCGHYCVSVPFASDASPVICDLIVDGVRIEQVKTNIPPPTPASNDMKEQLQATRAARRDEIWGHIARAASDLSLESLLKMLHVTEELGAIDSSTGLFVPITHTSAWVRVKWEVNQAVLSVIEYGSSFQSGTTPWRNNVTPSEILVNFEHNMYKDSVLGGALDQVIGKEIFETIIELVTIATSLKIGAPPSRFRLPAVPPRLHVTTPKTVVAYPTPGWLVTLQGLEYVAHPYRITKERLHEGDWVAHMRHKTWVNIDEFDYALTSAQLIHDFLDREISTGYSPDLHGEILSEQGPTEERSRSSYTTKYVRTDDATMTQGALPEPTIAVLTALPTECAAVRLALGNARRHVVRGTGAGRSFYVGEVPIDGLNTHHTVAIALLLDMGNNAASIRSCGCFVDEQCRILCRSRYL